MTRNKQKKEKQMKKLIIAIVAGIATFATSTMFGQDVPPSASKPRASRPSAVNIPTTNNRPAPGNRPQAGNRPQTASRNGRRDYRRDRMSNNEQRLYDRIAATDSIRELRRFIQEVVSARDDDLRAALVDALSVADGHSPSDFVYFLADRNADVAESAFNAWTMALGDMNAHRRVRAIIDAGQMLQGMAGGHSQTQQQPPPPMPVGSHSTPMPVGSHSTPKPVVSH